MAFNVILFLLLSRRASLFFPPSDSWTCGGSVQDTILVSLTELYLAQTTTGPGPGEGGKKREAFFFDPIVTHCVGTQTVTVRMRRVVRAVTMDFIGVGKRSLTFLILFALGMELHARALAPIDRLPSGRLLVGYATDRCLREEDRIIAAVENGVNVIIWSFAHFERQGDGELRVHPTFNVDKVRALRERLEGTGAEVAHLVAFGGWNGPHPSTKASGKQWFECWRIWNDKHGMPFDGIDWDLEGHDDPKATSASFTKALVDLVSDFSVVAHRAGFTVALAPAQSYLDAATSEFSLRLNHEPGVNPGKFQNQKRLNRSHTRVAMHTRPSFIRLESTASLLFLFSYMKAILEHATLLLVFLYLQKHILLILPESIPVALM